MKKQSDSLDRKVKLILSKDLGDPDELKADEPSSDEEQGLNTVKEEDISSAEDGTLLKVINLKLFDFWFKEELYKYHYEANTIINDVLFLQRNKSNSPPTNKSQIRPISILTEANSTVSYRSSRNHCFLFPNAK